MKIIDWLRGKKGDEERHSDHFSGTSGTSAPEAGDVETLPASVPAESFTASNVDTEVTSLLDEMSERKYPEWFNAYEALEKIGSRAIVPLIDAIESSNSQLRGRAMDLLGRIGDDRAIGPLEMASSIGEEDFRRLAGISGSTYITDVGGMRLEIPLSELWEEYRENAGKALDGIRERLSSPASATSSTSEAASESDDTQSLLAELGRRDFLTGPNPALAKLRELGTVVVPELLGLMDSSEVTVAEDAIQLLGEIGAKEAIPKLRSLTQSQWIEVSRAAYSALAVLEKEDNARLHIDIQNPFEQVAGLWTSIIQGRQDLYPAEVLHDWCMEAMDAMPNLEFASNEKQAKAWGMLGSLTFKSIHPEWPGGFDGTEHCPEAKRCYEEALRAEPGDSWWQGWVDRFS